MQNLNQDAGSLVQQTFNSSQFATQFNAATLVLARGTGNPTYTRATTKTMQDWERLITLPSGAAPLAGSRTVRNYVAGTSEDITSASWVASTATRTSANIATGNGANSFIFQGTVLGAGRDVVSRFKLYRISGTSQISISADSGTTYTNITLTTTPTVYSVFKANAIAGSGPVVRIASGGDQIGINEIQHEDVTGQSNQNPSEYVSVGAIIGSPTQAITPGTANNYFSTPEATANILTNSDVEIIANMAMASWSSATGQSIIGKLIAGGWLFETISGKLRFFDGTSNIDSTTTVGFIDGTSQWVKLSHQYNNGAGGRTTKFYTSSDGAGWTQLGTDVVTAGASSIVNGAGTPLTIGAHNNGAGLPANASFRRITLAKSIGGAATVDFNPTRATSPQGTMTAATGEVWTANGSAAYYGVTGTAYHGSGIDGFKSFPYLNGNTVASNVVTEAQGTPISGIAYYPEPTATQIISATADIRDMSGANWAKVTMSAAKTATGADGIANSASTVTASGANSTILYTVTAAATSRTYSAWVRRKTGTGTILLKQTGTTLDITALINSTTYTQVQLNANILNVQIGFQINTSGDAIEVDFNNFEAGAVATSPITTGAAARNEDLLTYQTAGNISGTVGTLYAEITAYSAAGTFGSIVSTYTGAGGAPMQVTNQDRVGAYDGTTTRQLSASITRPITTKTKVLTAWDATPASYGSVAGVNTTGAFDGDFNLGANMAIGKDVLAGSQILNGKIYNVYGWQTALPIGIRNAMTL